MKPSISQVLTTSRASLRLTRAENCVAVFALALLGGLAGSENHINRVAIALAATAMALVLAFGNCINDLLDRDLDRVAKPRRPLPSGALSPTYAVRLALLLAVAALCVGASLGALFGALIAGMLALSWLYSYRLKATVMVGHITVAGLTSLAVLGGAMAASQSNLSFLIVGAMAGSMVLATEVAKAVEDRQTDAEFGIYTVAHVVSNRAQGLLVAGAGLIYVMTVSVGIRSGAVSSTVVGSILVLPALPFLALAITPDRAVRDMAGLAAKIGKVLWPIAIVSALVMYM